MVIQRYPAWIAAAEGSLDSYGPGVSCISMHFARRWNRDPLHFTEYSQAIEYRTGGNRTIFTPCNMPEVSEFLRAGSRANEVQLRGVFADDPAEGFTREDMQARRWRRLRLDFIEIDPRTSRLRSPWFHSLWCNDPPGYDLNVWTMSFTGLTGRVGQIRGDTFGIKCPRQVGVEATGCTVPLLDPSIAPHFSATAQIDGTATNTVDELTLILTPNTGPGFATQALVADRWREQHADDPDAIGWFGRGRLIGIDPFNVGSQNLGADIQIRSHTVPNPIGGGLYRTIVTMNEPLSFVPTNADRFTIAAGCDQTEFNINGCGPKFGNRRQFAGQTHMGDADQITERGTAT